MPFDAAEVTKQLQGEIIRQGWIATLRAKKYMKAVYHFGVTWGHHNYYCAIGVLLKERGDEPACLTSLQSLSLARRHISEGVAKNVARLNDMCRWTFPQIANWIDANTTVNKHGRIIMKPRVRAS